ncbi:uncharacterized protein L969DRAFT_84823 [Mixia osmundae IAM 14324]|uniref:uncharacterized protein n=1 Tax=Mixia osmundae (strain CBS 9802 / IAM 14324 / JCM 22182 / KY 12970) TaxID=764103 RepID=UPI0004A54B9B|nr:uncharacterized protein L969DRAFT_84823 [Mixia osmundae IAM 14324]KEI42934.1 hypothetical protein L969DRAFT_84823 [Mixia osmundae IAM 14324]
MPPKARQYVYRPKRDNYSAICRCSRGFGNRQSKLNCTNRAHASPTPTGRPRKRARSELSSGRHLEGVSLDNEPAVIDDTITDFLFDRGILSGAGPALKFGRDHAPGDGRELSLEDIVDLLYNQSITLESAVTRMLDRVFPEEADRARAAVQSYMAMFEPSSAFELAFTDRYAVTQMLRESLIDGKLGLTVLARRDFAEGEIIPGLDGPVFPHDPNLHNDFSTFYDTSRQREMGLCGPARLVNHDCNNNVRFVRLEGGRIGFRATRPIANGEEILTTYGPSSFGANNVGCCCQTCELYVISLLSQRPVMTVMTVRTKAPTKASTSLVSQI